MASWKIFESFDPASGGVYLDIVDSSARPPEHGKLEARVLETFDDFPEAHGFLDGYIAALKRGRERPIREVFCGKHAHPGCDVGPCPLGATSDDRCAYRDRDKSRAP